MWIAEYCSIIYIVLLWTKYKVKLQLGLLIEKKKYIFFLLLIRCWIYKKKKKYVCALFFNKICVSGMRVQYTADTATDEISET